MKKSALYLTLTVFGVFLFATIAFGDSVKSTTQGGVYNWQTWVAPNKNASPYWDNLSYDGGSCQNKANIGYFLSNSGCYSTGGPGAIPFWGATYDSGADTGGQADLNFFFQKDILSIGGSFLSATLTANKGGGITPLDEFGWYDASTPAFIHSSYPMMTAANPTGTFASCNACFSSYGFYLKTKDWFVSGEQNQHDVVYRTEASRNQRLDDMTFFDTADQHFTVFRQSVSGSDFYWIGMEDLRFIRPPPAGYSDIDYNDIMATVQTTPALTQPEYYFTSPSVTTVRLLDQDTVYLSSFMPNMNNSYQFWPGNLKAYQLNADGTLPYPLPNSIWSAGDNLKNRDPVTRNIKTFVGNSMKDFTTSNLTDNDLYGTGNAAQYRRQITVNSGQVSGTLSNFPMLISNTDPGLKNVAYGGHVLDTGGSCTTSQQGCDIYFTDSNLNVLPSEIERYDGSAGTLVAWVGVPSIANGTVIHMWYGSNVPTYNPTGVWTLDGNYKATWHAKNNANDSTGQGNNGTFSYNTYADGKSGLGKAFSLPGNSTSYVNVPYASSLDLPVYTVSAWIYWDGLNHGSTWMPILAKSPNPGGLENYSLFFNNNGGTGRVEFESYIAGSRRTIITPTSIPANTWTHIAGTYDGATLRLYLNGAASGTPVSVSGSARTGSDPFRIGSTNAPGSWWFGGRVDEVRVSNVRSAGWIATEYNNQSFPSTFYALGQELVETQATCGSECQKLISYVRGTDTYNIKADPSKDLKLGDIFRSNPVIVGEPSRFFQDECFDKCSDGSQSFYQANQNRTKVLIVGANDGMLHAFNAATGDEVWGFIPNSLLISLKLMTSRHTYYVDSAPKVADVWFDYNGDHKKTANEWKTVLVSGLRKGGKSYFALDITNTSSPQYLWEFPNPSDAATLAKLGQSWSEPAIGRVKVGGYEKWVAFIGGGFDSTKFINITTGRAYNDAGMAFFVVDMQNGSIIKQFSFSGDSRMTYPLTAPPTAVDTNFDGYIDRVYIGDVGGQMWVFDLSDPNNVNNWTGKILFTAPVSSSEKHPIFYQASVTFDKNDMPWVYFGTGDRENPTSSLSPYAERFYAVQDDGLGTYPRTEGLAGNLKNATSTTTFNQDTSKKGWYIILQKTSNTVENAVSKPVIFNQLVYFTATTYNPTTDPCAVAGTANLYTVEFLSGGGAIGIESLTQLSGTPNPTQFTQIGTGVPSSPVISVDSKARGSIMIGTSAGPIYSHTVISPPNKAVHYWREVIPFP